MITLALVAAAVAWLFWPRGSAAPAVPAASELFKVAPLAPAAAAPLTLGPTPDPRPAIDRLLQVRDRLRETGRLDDANAKAVDQLVLELVHGEEKK
jgi:hypothetical protein